MEDTFDWWAARVQAARDAENAARYEQLTLWDDSEQARLAAKVVRYHDVLTSRAATTESASDMIEFLGGAA